MAFSAHSRTARGFSQLKLFLALSRTPHGIIDMATPAFAALLWLGTFPSPGVTILGLVTAFAGYTAVYALNDLVDWRVDRQKMQIGDCEAYPRRASSQPDPAAPDPEDPNPAARPHNDIDAILIRHPMAQGLLSFKEGLVWVAGWSAVALIGAWLLNPVCLLIFMLGCILEIVYCLLLKVSHLRTIVSGGVKSLGALAAVFAVDPAPAPFYLIGLFLCLFFWEIGGQNIPNDWSDIQEDRRIKARTIPVHFGPRRAITVIMVCLVTAVLMNLILFQLTHATFALPYIWAALAFGLYLLIWPAFRLFRSQRHDHVLALFNKASYYPLSLFVVVLVKISF